MSEYSNMARYICSIHFPEIPSIVIMLKLHTRFVYLCGAKMIVVSTVKTFSLKNDDVYCSLGSISRGLQRLKENPFFSKLVLPIKQLEKRAKMKRNNALHVLGDTRSTYYNIEPDHLLFLSIYYLSKDFKSVQFNWTKNEFL